MKIKQNANELIIRETPGCLWIFGLLFCFVGGVFVYGSLGGFTNWNEVSVWIILMSFVMGAIACGVGYWVILRAPVTKIVISRASETVTHTRYGLFGVKKNIYSFDRIKQFCLVEEKDDESNTIWSLGMELASGETVKISSLPSHFEEFKINFVFESNKFMYKQMPSHETVYELEDESRPKIS